MIELGMGRTEKELKDPFLYWAIGMDLWEL